MIIYQLPWPPSVNRYWRNYRGRTVISTEGHNYQQNVMASVLAKGKPSKLKDRLRVEIFAFPPDQRKRDLDNLPKAILDALERAKVFDDDSQIDQLLIMRCTIVSPGGITVKITPLSS